MSFYADVAWIARKAHERWQEEWLRVHGDVPHCKTTTDSRWIALHGGVAEVNLAATSYDDLPREFSDSHWFSAETAMTYVQLAGRDRRPFDAVYIEQIAAMIHSKWLERHGATASEALRVPYAELPEDEKVKDRIFVTLAIEAWQQI